MLPLRRNIILNANTPSDRGSFENFPLTPLNRLSNSRQRRVVRRERRRPEADQATALLCGDRKSVV